MAHFRSKTKRVSSELEIEHLGVDYLVQFDWDLELDYDPHYGSDADGNRGMPMWERSASLVAITSIETSDLMAVPESTMATFLTAIDAFIDNDDNDPESRDDEEPDPDRYRDDPDRGDW